MMDTEAKHGLPKVVALADKLARLVLDQVAADGCVNLENIRNALMGPLAHDEMDRQDERMRHAEKRYQNGVKKLAEGITENMLRPSDAAEALAYAWMGVDIAKPREGLKGPVGPIGPCAPKGAVPIPDVRHLVMWEHRDGARYAVRPSHRLLKAFGDAIATNRAQCVSINEGTYVLPDGEVLSELEMIKRVGTDGR